MIDASLADLLNRISVELPQSYYNVVELGLTHIKPWEFIPWENVPVVYDGLNGAYPVRSVLPFARRQDNDDFACFLLKTAGADVEVGPVVVIHRWAEPGYEFGEGYEDFWGWFRDAIETMIEFDAPDASHSAGNAG